ncbi:hypothetical protein [Parvularcula lutaonensis]|uniref:Uncharacterized protein n=1 Tax=Parvularcula lutaonensis TaxID=491923 RepID=A0ABV7MDE2_9PROT|nr:hypothetical protein [Parvularcula lutaonensis]GGY52896.1 hypothetical protein GCM10007148_22640 [Parvularcula lutaonensis]
MSRTAMRAALSGAASLLYLLGDALLAAPLDHITFGGPRIELEPELIAERPASWGLAVAAGVVMALAGFRQHLDGMGIVRGHRGDFAFGTYAASRFSDLLVNGTPLFQISWMG